MADQHTPARAGEFELIARHFAPLASNFPGAYGLGDDTARFAPPDGTDLVVTTDTLVCGIHFLADDPPRSVAHKTLRVSLSDLAAAGARPLAYQLSTAWPPGIEESWIAAFAQGLAEDQAQFAIDLSGGDTVATSGPMTLTVTAFGSVPRHHGLGRAGARPGDRVMVSGTIGDGALGLRVLQGKMDFLAPQDRAHAIDRYRVPRPRMALGLGLPGLASACIDVSDGLVADLGHLCERSGCGARIEIDRIPLSAAARAAVARDATLLERLIVGGDDYELLFAVPPAHRAAVLALARDDVGVAEIGYFVADEGVAVTRADGTEVTISAPGWQHF